jgi:predicted Zn-dependent peptidase
VKGLIQKYFGEIPSGGTVPAVTCEKPFDKLPLTRTFNDQNANLPAVFVSYGMPAQNSADAYPLQLLAAILAGGESSRLHERLVRQEKAALETFSFPVFRRGPGVFMAGAIANQGVGVEKLQSLLEDEVGKVRRDGVTAAELAKAKNQARAEMARGLQTAFGKAEALQEASYIYGDPNAIRTNMEKTMAVTLEDVRRVANQYLTPQNRATIIDQPPAAAGKE